uniref:UvrD-like helicase C-terminal domain-containing protein n=1 Tax=Biomphalaria glabrata TaxID=6526 RepID=A0A2C9L747_BIOGL
VLEKGCRLRPLSFDSRQHKLLDTELKQLYTAVTRARVNVWIFDENSEKRAPMFEYFKALKLVQDLEEFKQNHEEKGFMETSTPQEWKSKGDKYLSEKKYLLARDCY